MDELNEITVRRAKSGDKKAFKSLYDWYAPFVWRVAFKMSQSEDLAQEIVQETFIRIHISLKHFRAESALSTWIYRIVYNAANSCLSKVTKIKMNEPYEDTLAGSYRSDSYDEREMMNQILSTLTSQERFLLVAREVDALSFEELSSITSESSGSLRTRLSRLKEKIRDQFTTTPVLKEVV
ncbi:MAG TPA: RNA polymerase sigma factor [Chitinispirillaceae bacterium]|nr:RNA polymerase sigma factor [Chitinispirillaceae bacterium]